MPRTAVATATPPADLEQLIDRGRNQGHLSLTELRDAFAQAGISPAEGRSILRELTDAGVSLAAEDEPALAKTAKKTKRSARKTSDTETTDSKAAKAKDKNMKADDDEDGPDDLVLEVSAEVAEEVDAENEPLDLDDNQSVMGDSVHTYLKSIGRRTLLTAAQEVELARRIEAGLYAEYKLESTPDLTRRGTPT